MTMIMKNSHSFKLSWIALFCTIITAVAASKKPNIIVVMVDDAGVGDFTNYGGKHIKTPIMEKMAQEGMQFNNAYSGNAVCGPTRCSLMTGLHPGHAIRRANQSNKGLLPLPENTVTVASLLKKAGYATGGFGKWGLGNVGTTGVPEKQGFDTWYGYYDQRHAHDYYPEFLVKNSEVIPLEKNKNGAKGAYTQYLIEAETIKFIEQNKDRPFFCYAAWTPPHAKFEIPSDDPNLVHYKDKKWKSSVKNYAAMVSLLDQGVGRIIAKVKEVGIDDNTLIIYTSDNGANTQLIKAIESSAGLRGAKRSLYEGGIRAPFVARWPGKIAAGSESDALIGQVDILATAIDLAGQPAIKDTDGVSLTPLLFGSDPQLTHPFLYFEIYEGAFQQSVRMGDWKGYRKGLKDLVEVYNLRSDPFETKNIASKHPDIAKQLSEILIREHLPSPHYTTPNHAKSIKKRNKTKRKNIQ